MRSARMAVTSGRAASARRVSVSTVAATALMIHSPSTWEAAPRASASASARRTAAWAASASPLIPRTFSGPSPFGRGWVRVLEPSPRAKALTPTLSQRERESERGRGWVRVLKFPPEAMALTPTLSQRERESERGREPERGRGVTSISTGAGPRDSSPHTAGSILARGSAGSAAWTRPVARASAATRIAAAKAREKRFRLRRLEDLPRSHREHREKKRTHLFLCVLCASVASLLERGGDGREKGVILFGKDGARVEEEAVALDAGDDGGRAAPEAGG